MFLKEFNHSVQGYFSNLVKKLYQVDLAEIPVVIPPDPKFGDLALSFPFVLAKQLKKAPRAIAEEVRAAAGSIPSITKITVEGAGYINLFMDRAAVLQSFLSYKQPAFALTDGKVIVEHTNINPNKAAHIGHLRNAVIGDTLGRMLKALGAKVEIQNYLDDTGTQVADVVVGFEQIRKLDLTAIKMIQGKFDYYCWDLYKTVGDFYAEDKARDQLRLQTLFAIEHGTEPTASLAAWVADRIVECHLATMLRLDIRYDALPRESTILKMKFWDQAFELLKAKGAIYLVEEGKNKGCWVMRSKDKSSSEDVEEQEKVIVRSNGTVTYTGKDIAYQLWKLGLLGRTFNFRNFQSYPDGKPLWESTEKTNDPSAPAFGGASLVYNVIDNRQAYLQKIVKQGVAALGYEKAAQASIHFSYEPVALTPAAAMELGFELSADEQKRSMIEMSGRKGLGVKADDLLDRLFALCEQEVTSRNPELSGTESKLISQKIARGALRFFMLKHGEDHVMAFDFRDALAFDGESGPYLQNAIVRARSILRKLDEKGIKYEPQLSAYTARLTDYAKHFDVATWEFLISLLRIEEIAYEALQRLQLSYAAKYAFGLAQRFHNFYHHSPILREENADVREARLFVTLFFIDRMQRCLNMLGIEVPEKM